MQSVVHDVAGAVVRVVVHHLPADHLASDLIEYVLWLVLIGIIVRAIE
jgi:hypothetical protein